MVKIYIFVSAPFLVKYTFRKKRGGGADNKPCPFFVAKMDVTFNFSIKTLFFFGVRGLFLFTRVAYHVQAIGGGVWGAMHNFYGREIQLFDACGVDFFPLLGRASRQ